MKKCKLCGIGEAVVPDRNSRSSKISVCRKCHAERLLGDIRNISADWIRKRKEWENR
jgi:hypothetical protein